MFNTGVGDFQARDGTGLTIQLQIKKVVEKHALTEENSRNTLRSWVKTDP